MSIAQMLMLWQHQCLSVYTQLISQIGYAWTVRIQPRTVLLRGEQSPYWSEHFQLEHPAIAHWLARLNIFVGSSVIWTLMNSLCEGYGPLLLVHFWWYSWGHHGELGECVRTSVEMLWKWSCYRDTTNRSSQQRAMAGCFSWKCSDQ